MTISNGSSWLTAPERLLFHSKGVLSLDSKGALRDTPLPYLKDGQVVETCQGVDKGRFVWSSDDMSVSVSLDEITSGEGDGGVYVAPVSDKTGASGAWMRIREDESFRPQWYGAVGDGVTDDSYSLAYTTRSAFNLCSTIDRGIALNCIVNLGFGRFRVAQEDAIFSLIPEVTGGAASFIFNGLGRAPGYTSDVSATTIEFDPPTGADDEYLINNTSKITYSQFNNITFTSTNNATFWNGPEGSGVQTFEFHNCSITRFANLFLVGGSTNNSEWTFTKCKFSRFSGTAFEFDNLQSVNWRFFACDAEVFTGTLFSYKQGASVTWDAGSIIPTASTARIVHSPADASSVSGNNSPHLTMSGVRLEMRDGALLFEKLPQIAPLFVVFNGCGMGGFNVPDDGTKILKWVGDGNVVFRDCENMSRYYWDHTVNGDSAVNSLRVIYDNCDLNQDIFDNSVFDITGYTTFVSRKPLFLVSNNNNPLFDGEYRPDSNSVLGTSSHRRAVAFDKRGNRLIEVFRGAGWPHVVSLDVPPSTLTKVELYPISTSSYGAETATVEVKDTTGTSLCSFTWTMNSPEQVVFSQDVLVTLGSSTAPLSFEFSSSYSGEAIVTFLGRMYLTY